MVERSQYVAYRLIRLSRSVAVPRMAIRSENGNPFLERRIHSRMVHSQIATPVLRTLYHSQGGIAVPGTDKPFSERRMRSRTAPVKRGVERVGY